MAVGTNLIGYDGLKSFGSPSYYAQVMFNANRGDEVVEATGDVAPDLFTSVTRDSRTGALYVKAVNVSADPREVDIRIAGLAAIDPEGWQVVMTGGLKDVNSAGAPRKVAPSESALLGVGPRFNHVFPGHSITVLVLREHT
jgi:alpha-N-arabinofuranosidase